MVLEFALFVSAKIKILLVPLGRNSHADIKDIHLYDDIESMLEN